MDTIREDTVRNKGGQRISVTPCVPVAGDAVAMGDSSKLLPINWPGHMSQSDVFLRNVEM